MSRMNVYRLADGCLLLTSELCVPIIVPAGAQHTERGMDANQLAVSYRGLADMLDRETSRQCPAPKPPPAPPAVRGWCIVWRGDSGRRCDVGGKFLQRAGYWGDSLCVFPTRAGAEEFADRSIHSEGCSIIPVVRRP